MQVRLGEKLLFAGEKKLNHTQQYTPSGQQSRQRNHSPVLHHVKYRPQGVDSGHGHFHENISDLSRQGMGSLENFEKNTHGVSEYDGHVTTISPFPTKGYTNVATSPFNTFKHAGPKLFQQDDLSLENQPTVINSSTVNSLTKSRKPIVLNTQRTDNTLPLAKLQTPSHHAEEENEFPESTARENYVLPSTHKRPTQHALRPLHLSYDEAKDRFRLKGLVGAAVT